MYLPVCCSSLSSGVPSCWPRPSRLTEKSGPGSHTSGGSEGTWEGEGSSRHSPSWGAGRQRLYHPDRSPDQATTSSSKAQRPVGRTVSRQVCRMRHVAFNSPVTWALLLVTFYHWAGRGLVTAPGYAVAGAELGFEGRLSGPQTHTCKLTASQNVAKAQEEHPPPPPASELPQLLPGAHQGQKSSSPR